VSDALTVTPSDGGPVKLTFHGPLRGAEAGAVWNRVIEAVGDAETDVVFDLENVTECDGVGLALLTRADRLARTAGHATSFTGASEELDELIRMAQLEPGETPAARRRANLFEAVGTATANLGRTIREFIGFVGSLTAATGAAFASLNPPRILEILRNCTRVGADAVPVISLMGGLVGFILAVQAAKALSNIGAISLVPMVVGFATLREFGPLIAGIVLAGRSGAAFAAEIGTMKVTEELDAYTTFALDPMVVLVFPRILAATIVTPMLVLFSILLAVGGGYLPMAAEGYGFATYLKGVVDTVGVADLGQALVKAVVFGVIFSALGCFHGLRTGSGSDAVGASTTRAVVSGIGAILLADSIISGIFYSRGF
jgi:phospholipid/cholesterol/gamma-HCH transport system permease protein